MRMGMGMWMCPPFPPHKAGKEMEMGSNPQQLTIYRLVRLLHPAREWRNHPSRDEDVDGDSHQVTERYHITK
jgi:hypothetical protein